jgi:hypothetical protein
MSHSSSTLVVPGGHVEKPCKGKHPAFSKTVADEPIPMTGTLAYSATSKERTRVPITRMPLRRRLTD